MFLDKGKTDSAIVELLMLIYTNQIVIRDLILLQSNLPEDQLKITLRDQLKQQDAKIRQLLQDKFGYFPSSGETLN
jgi:hypothetical protein